MSRVKRGVAAHAKHKKVLKQAKGFYGRFIDGLGKAGVEIDRKVLADLAVREPAAFQALVEKAQGALA